MWYAILLITSLATGQQTFSLFKLPFDSEYQCQEALSHIEDPYKQGFSIQAGCVEIPYNQEI